MAFAGTSDVAIGTVIAAVAFVAGGSGVLLHEQDAVDLLVGETVIIEKANQSRMSPRRSSRTALGLQQAGEPQPGQRGFLARRIPAIAAERHAIDAAVLHGLDALPARILVEIGRHGGIEISEQDDLRIPDEDLLDGDGATGGCVARRVLPAGELDVEIIVRAWAAHTQKIRIASRHRGRGAAAAVAGPRSRI